MKVEFPGGARADVLMEGFRIRTDQPADHGGSGSAPSPFDLFLASIAACAGFYALRFFQQRGLDAGGLSVAMDSEWDAERKRVRRLRVDVAVPPGFPDKYRDALRRAVGQCTVKRHLAEPPDFEVEVAPALDIQK